MPRWLAWTLAGLLLGSFLLWATLLRPDPVPVKVTPVEQGRVESTVTNTKAGTVKARRRSLLSPEYGGLVREIAHREGERVEQGEAIVVLDGATQRAQLRLAVESSKAVEASRREACVQRNVFAPQ